MEDNDKYTIELPRTGSTVYGSFVIGDWIDVQSDGSVILISGPYCQWPKTEPRIFEVNIKC